ncbi:MAG: tRNA 2-thiouridine(34) synthase MnmA [Methylacidiphilales bacterium]|nr:tRNA 2-thiouridine(34) synthase MnmA [Candidatus Methylacidiphilales bacterium]MDW8349900.1 tRNA 2-thiouridine(34) synthase MnmA [Verrucomicrobiae bacterium]
MSVSSKPRVLLGMSGGVDSSVAAYLLKKAGYDVIGITLKIWPQDCLTRAEDKCCGPQAVADARMVAHALDIPHYVLDEAESFSRMVIDYFTEEYRQGRTPIPCVLCNEKLKFGKLRTTAASLGAEYIATGHYARVEHFNDGRPSVLRRAIDRRKDQSYFLFSLSPDQLRKILFPIGHLNKNEVREIAQSLGLKVYDKEESQEICFVPNNDYLAFLKSHYQTHHLQFKTGGIYHRDGRYLGEHTGIENYTIGQRRGLPGGQGQPLYVIHIDAEQHRIIVGPESDLMRQDCLLQRVNWLQSPPSPDENLEVKLRHNAPPVRARVHQLPDNQARLVFDEPQSGIAPGQAAVFFRDDLVIGGGWVTQQDKATSLEVVADAAIK